MWIVIIVGSATLERYRYIWAAKCSTDQVPDYDPLGDWFQGGPLCMITGGKSVTFVSSRRLPRDSASTTSEFE